MTMKYKCNNCGNVFEGDYSNFTCPQCGSTDVKNQGGPNIPWKKILIGVGAVILLILLIKMCSSDSIEISMAENQDAKQLVFTVEGVSKSSLKADYKIIVYNQNSVEIGQLFFNGKSENTQYSTENFTANECYTFNFVKKAGGDINLKWKTSNQYCYYPPVAPTISCEKIPDCKSGTYTIKVKVETGNAVEYYIDGKGQASNVFNNIKPRQQPYVVKACDANGLMSTEQSVYCTAKGVQSFHITEAEIQAEFDKVAAGNQYVGDAMAKISQGKNIKLASSIDGCSTLEEVLNYAYNMEQRYKVKAEIKSNGCSDSITSLTVTH